MKPTSDLPILNISCYAFTEIHDGQALRLRLLAEANRLGLKGTILIAPEGINVFLAGQPDDVRGLMAQLKQDPRFATLVPKESWSATEPFGKMKVRLKKEIIRMNHPTIRPADGRAPAVAAATLKTWLDRGLDDEGREVVLLDTRNAFEVDHGTFNGALDWRIHKFTEFPDALAQHKNTLLDKTVVSFCTGGIRCEKAAIYMREIGLPKVLQLEGGILKYFEEVGGAHYNGHCFVFDERIALDPALKPEQD